MRRIFEVSCLDTRIDTTIVVDSDIGLLTGHLLAVFVDGRFEVLLDECDKIVTLNLFGPSLKVFA